jgi:hypothetical protein
MFVFTADNHVNLRGLRPEIPLEDTLRPLNDIVQYCLLNKLPLVLGGDLYDTNNPPARLVARVNEILARMNHQGLEVWAIQGNHDKDPETPWATIAPGVKWLNERMATIGGLEVYGLDFAPASTIAPKISAMPACDVVVIHQALRQGLKFEDAWNCDLDWFDPEKVKNVLAGDLHMAKRPLWSTKHDVFATYPGTPYMTTVEEDPCPTFILVKGMTPEGFLDFERLPLWCRPFFDVTADNAGAVEGFAEGLSLDPKPIVLLRYPVDCPGVLKAANTFLKDTFLIEKPLPAKGGFVTSRKLIAEAREGLTLQKVVNERTKDDVGLHALLSDLVACKDKECAASTIASHRQISLAPQGTP